jgi:phosphatidate cytidylyltransferase
MAFPAQPSTRWSLLAVPLIMLLVLAAKPDAGNRQAARYALLGALWVGLPLALISMLGAGGDVLAWFQSSTRLSAEGGHQPALVTGVLILIWSNDVGAYFAGSTLGRTKLAPSISPNKSWEGVVGGWLLGMVIAFVFTRLCDGMALGPWLGMATLTTVFGTAGDLLESRLKRRTGAKDSGTLLPGHGGFLDRFDSLLLVAPIAWLWFRVFFPFS